MRKRVLTAILAFALVFTLTGCERTGDSDGRKCVYPSVPDTIELPNNDGARYDFFAAQNGYFYHNNGGKAELIYIKGINMGLTAATTDLSNPNVSYDTYMEWFGQIKAMGANIVRAFTVMNPNFYDALYDFNVKSADDPLYLMQGIWFSEDLMYQLTDALESDEILISAFKRSVRETIDIIHGESDYTVYGEFSPAIYKNDISEYVVGYILGLEYPADFVIETNASHPDEADFCGEYLYTAEGAAPFEAFLCEVGETLIAYETDTYSHQTPVAFLNWQTLDTLTHSNEPFDEEDEVSVNTENVLKKSSYAPGLFAAIDVYPYYPEFMNHQGKYLDYRDENGNADPYRAYLRDLKTQYSVPVLIAEYGLSTSRGVAHTSAMGYDQGGLTEQQQGEYCAQMTRSIALEGYCGGLLFSWQDEWFKRTWNTVMYYPDDPTERTHNLSSAEQSYGLVSFDVSRMYPDGSLDDWDGIEYVCDGVKCQFDADYLHILVEMPDGCSFEDSTYYVPISVLGVGSTYSATGKISFERPCDFILVINGMQNTRILCDGYYDLFNYRYSLQKKVFDFGLEEKNSGVYNAVNTFVSNEMYLPDDDVTISAKYYESGALRYGNANPTSDEYCSQADFYERDGKVEVRIAWYLLNVVNSRLGICIDDLCADDITFTDFEDIYIGAGSSGMIGMSSAGYKKMGQITVTQRTKASYNYIKDVFEEISKEIK